MGRFGLMRARPSTSTSSSPPRGEVEHHRFQKGLEAGSYLPLKRPGQQPDFSPLFIGAHYDGQLHAIVAECAPFRP